MKKNFFATLIIVVLTLIMSFTLTSCDLFNRGNGSGSNGGGSGSEEGTVLEGLDRSKLTASAIANVALQQEILDVIDEPLEITKAKYKEALGVDISLSKEDIVNVVAETMVSGDKRDRSRSIIDPNTDKAFVMFNYYLYNEIKNNNINLSDVDFSDSSSLDVFETLPKNPAGSRKYFSFFAHWDRGDVSVSDWENGYLADNDSSYETKYCSENVIFICYNSYDDIYPDMEGTLSLVVYDAETQSVWIIYLQDFFGMIEEYM